MKWLRRLVLAALGLVLALGLLEAALRLTLTPEDIRRRTSPESPAEAARWTDHPFLPFVGKPHATYTLDVPVSDTASRLLPSGAMTSPDQPPKSEDEEVSTSPPRNSSGPKRVVWG